MLLKPLDATKRVYILLDCRCVLPGGLYAVGNRCGVAVVAVDQHAVGFAVDSDVDEANSVVSGRGLVGDDCVVDVTLAADRLHASIQCTGRARSGVV